MANQVTYILELRDRYSKVAAAATRANERLKTSFKKAQFQTAKFGNQLKATAKSVKGFALKMTAAFTAPFLFLSKSMVDSASDAVETANKFRQVFDSTGKRAESVAKSYAKNFGVASSTSKKLLSDTGDLLVGFGFTGDQALDLSLKVNSLAADLASFQNFEGGANRASMALTKSLLGETESVKALGIVIRQQSPEYKALVKNYQKTRGATLLQAKALTALDIALSQSKKAVGDISRTWDDYANVARRSAEATKEARESIGRILLPLALKLALKIEILSNKFSGLDESTQKIIVGVAGVIAVVGPILLLFVGLVAGVGAVITTFTVLGSILAAMGAAFFTVTLPVLALVVIIGGAAALIIKHWDSIKSGFAIMADFIGEKANIMKEKLMVAFDFMKNMAIDFINNMTPVGLIFRLVTGGELIKKNIDEADINVSGALSESAVNVTTNAKDVLEVNLNAPEGVINNVEGKSEGNTPGKNFNIGINTVR